MFERYFSFPYFAWSAWLAVTSLDLFCFQYSSGHVVPVEAYVRQACVVWTLARLGACSS
jgi:hypothetical protein